MKKRICIVLGVLLALVAVMTIVYMCTKNDKKETSTKDEAQYISERKEATKEYIELFENKYPDAISIGANIKGTPYRNPVIWKAQMVLNSLPKETVNYSDAYDKESINNLTHYKFDYTTVLTEYRKLFGDTTDLEAFINDGRTNGFIPNESTIPYSVKEIWTLGYSSKLDSIIVEVVLNPYATTESYKNVFKIYSVEGTEITLEILEIVKDDSDKYSYYTKNGVYPLEDTSMKNLEHLLYIEDLDLPRVKYTFKVGETSTISDYILVSIEPVK